MINLINLTYDDYLSKYSDRNIICIGAGGTLRTFIDCHMEKLELLEKIQFITDNNKSLTGKQVDVLGRNVQVNYLPEFNEKIPKQEYVVFLLISDCYVIDVINQLDAMRVFDDIDCVYGMSTLRWGYTYYPTPKHRINIEHHKNMPNRIPKIIHYCWFGPNEIPPKDMECIKSFSTYNPDYKIIKWSEDNVCLDKMPLYVQQAYENKKYAFVTDYVRLAVVYEHGGIYLDTDVELFGSLDFILGFRMMFSYMEYGELSTGLGFASVKEATELKEMLNMYDNIPFVLSDGRLNLTPCPRYTNEYFRKKGVFLDNSLEVIDDILFLSSDYLCPLTPIECSDGSYQLADLHPNDYTIGIHWCNNSWKNKSDLDIFTEVKDSRALINQRIFSDWIRKRID